MQLEEYVEKAKKSALFTAPILEQDLSRFLKENAKIIQSLARELYSKGLKHVFWIGSGNSWCNLYLGKYLLDRFTDIPSDYFTSYEPIWRQPLRLNQDSVAIFASYSGNTEDTVESLRHAKKRGAKTIAIVNKEDSLMGKEADYVIPFNSTGLYIIPLATAYLFSLEIAKMEGKPVEGIIEELFSVPQILGKAYRDDEARARELATKYKDEDMFYVLSSGPLYGLGYKFAVTVFMENIRVNGSFIETSEFRHGPVEMLDRKKPVMVFLKGTDESREMTDRVIDLVKTVNEKVIVYDYADYGHLHPLLSPFALMVPLQWFAVYSALLRGITDLDKRVFMGHGKMARGQGVTWP